MPRRTPSEPKVVPGRVPKKPYRPPSVTEYGAVAKLTQTTLSGASGDGGVHPTNKMV